jgi:hypothetical protein
MAEPAPPSPELIQVWRARLQRLQTLLESERDEERAWLYRLRLHLFGYLLSRYASDVPSPAVPPATPSATDVRSPPDERPSPLASSAAAARRLARPIGRVLPRLRQLHEENAPRYVQADKQAQLQREAIQEGLRRQRAEAGRALCKAFAEDPWRWLQVRPAIEVDEYLGLSWDQVLAIDEEEARFMASIADDLREILADPAQAQAGPVLSEEDILGILQSRPKLPPARPTEGPDQRQPPR